MTCIAAAAVALLAACSGAQQGPRPEESPSVSTSAGHSQKPSAKAVAADGVKSALEQRLGAHEDHFGSGADSPCSASSPTMYTQECGSAAKAADEDAGFALTEIKGRKGFATLRSVAMKIQAAVADYQALGCAKDPAKAATRKACLEPAAVIAQAFPDLRSGANLGLAGK